MALPKNAMEVFQLLDKSNCRECGEKTCLAFAGAVFQGRKKAGDCPKLGREAVARFSEDINNRSGIEGNGEEYLQQLKDEVAGLDLGLAAQRIGARFAGNKLTLKILGKDFSVDTDGNLSADIHINPWVVVPFLNYVLYAQGEEAGRDWVSFRELREGKERFALFQKRCEEPMKQVADVYTDLFDDLVYMFSGRQVEARFQSDISVVLHPLPRVPIMVCYWQPEDGLESSLHLFFDSSADKNLDIGSLFSLGAGLAHMFGKIAQRHGAR